MGAVDESPVSEAGEAAAADKVIAYTVARRHLKYVPLVRFYYEDGLVVLCLRRTQTANHLGSSPRRSFDYPPPQSAALKNELFQPPPPDSASLELPPGGIPRHRPT